jgi:hypothetical protein
MSGKTSTEKIVNHDWLVDGANHKILLNLPQLFTRYLDGESNVIFGEPKIKKMREQIEKGYYPNTLMSDIGKAYDDYLVLKKMFNLE